MKRSSEPITALSFVRRYRRGKLDLRPGFQRGFVWSKRQQRMLVDTILRDMDIPKIYLREVSKGDYEYEVVDGQQRLQSVIDFCEGKFKTEANTEINGVEIGAISYEGLDEIDDDLREQFDSYQFSVVVLRDSTKEEVEEMFLRLQNGTSLTAQEKRNARSGKMNDFIRGLAEHEFFHHCAFTDRRSAFSHVATQMTMLEIENGPCNIKNQDLDKMYDVQNKDFDSRSTPAKEIHKTLSCLVKAFPEKTPELDKHSAISMFLLFRHLRTNYFIDGREREIADWFVKFEEFRREDANNPIDERDNELVDYQEKTSTKTDTQSSVTSRQEVLRTRLLTAIPDLVLLDSQRTFTDDQRRAIWRRDKGVCKIANKCDGVKLAWDGNWHADHKIPHSKGGKTTVENGQVTCAACNLAKGKN